MLLHLCQGNIVTLYLYENSSSKRETTVMNIQTYTSQSFLSPQEEIPTLLIHGGPLKLHKFGCNRQKVIPVTGMTRNNSLKKECHQNGTLMRTYFESLLAFHCKANLLVSYQTASHHRWVFDISGYVKLESLAQFGI